MQGRARVRHACEGRGGRGRGGGGGGGGVIVHGEISKWWPAAGTGRVICANFITLWWGGGFSHAAGRAQSANASKFKNSENSCFFSRVHPPCREASVVTMIQLADIVDLLHLLYPSVVATQRTSGALLSIPPPLYHTASGRSQRRRDKWLEGARGWS